MMIKISFCQHTLGYRCYWEVHHFYSFMQAKENTPWLQRLPMSPTVYLSHFSSRCCEERIWACTIRSAKIRGIIAVSSSLLASRLKLPHCGLCMLSGEESCTLALPLFWARRKKRKQVNSPCSNINMELGPC